MVGKSGNKKVSTKSDNVKTMSSHRFAFALNHYVDLEDQEMHVDTKLQIGPNGEYIGKPILDKDGIYKMIWDPRVMVPNNKKIKYFICKSEICPTTGRPHLQMYFELYKSDGRPYKTTSTAAAKLMQFPGGSGLPSYALKCALANITYVKKEVTTDKKGIYYCTDEMYELKSRSGKRSDIDELKQKIKDGMRLHEVLDSYPELYNKYNKFVKDACLLYAKKRAEYPTLVIRYGATSTGKSQSWFKLQQQDPSQVFVLPLQDLTRGNVMWFEGYYQQKYCVFEEFKPSSMSIATLLTFLDIGSKLVQFKGGSTQFNSPNIIITTNIHPLDWYKNANPEHRLALFRRIADIGKVYEHVYNGDPIDRTSKFVEIKKKYISSDVEKYRKIKESDQKYDNFVLYDDIQHQLDIDRILLDEYLSD